jgi:hypothetical protein
MKGLVLEKCQRGQTIYLHCDEAGRGKNRAYIWFDPFTDRGSCNRLREAWCSIGRMADWNKSWLCG